MQTQINPIATSSRFERRPHREFKHRPESLPPTLLDLELQPESEPKSSASDEQDALEDRLSQFQKEDKAYQKNFKLWLEIFNQRLKFQQEVYEIQMETSWEILDSNHKLYLRGQKMHLDQFKNWMKVYFGD